MSISTPRNVTGNSEGSGSKGQNFFSKESMKLNWNFQRGGVEQKGARGNFLEQVSIQFFWDKYIFSTQPKQFLLVY